LHTLTMQLLLEGKNRGGMQPQIQEYGEVLRSMKRMFRHIALEGNVHLLASAGETYITHETTGELLTHVDITGKLGRQIPRFFSIVGYMSVERVVRSDGNVRKEEHLMQLQPFANRYAKCRIEGIEAPVVIDPTVRMFYDADYGNLDALIAAGKVEEFDISDTQESEGD